jgi:hypothetical protein
VSQGQVRAPLFIIHVSPLTLQATMRTLATCSPRSPRRRQTPVRALSPLRARVCPHAHRPPQGARTSVCTMCHVAEQSRRLLLDVGRLGSNLHLPFPDINRDLSAISDAAHGYNSNSHSHSQAQPMAMEDIKPLPSALPSALPATLPSALPSALPSTAPSFDSNSNST